MKKVLMLFFVFYLLGNTLYAQQNVTISGRITGAAGESLASVSVQERHTNRGTVSNSNGDYSINVSPDGVLVFSYVGYETLEIHYNDRDTVINLELISAENILPEVVAIGYSRVRRDEFSGAVSSVNSREMNLTTPTIGQALVGKVSGVQISQTTGAPYESTKIRVRGIGSINASSDPLYVVDGYPVGNDLYINPNDIETIDILKDAASAAIYGSRASGGVVLITTKRGRAGGGGTLSYDVQVGINQLERKVELLNSNEFAQLMIDARNGSYKDLVENRGLVWNDAMYSDDNATRISRVGGSNASVISILPSVYDFANQKLIPQTVNTDWQDELYRNALVHRHNLSFIGGEQNVRYAISGGYLSQPGIILGTDHQRLNFRANIDASLTAKLKVGANVSLTDNKNKEVREGRFNQGPILGALIYMPIFEAYNADGTLKKFEAIEMNRQYNVALQTIENPVALATETKINRKGTRGTYNAFATYDIIPDLQFKVNLGYQNYNEKYEFYQPTSLSSGSNPPYSPQAIAAAYADARTISEKDVLAEYTLNYKKRFDRHSLDALLGYTAQQNTRDVIYVRANGFQNDRIQEITAKGADPSNFSLNGATGKATWTLLSYLARVGYNYASKYFLTGAFRVDGSSRFGPNNKYGIFPSVAASWFVSKEDFYKNAFGNASSLRFRVSWGLAGNNNIGNYNSQEVMSDPVGAVFGGNGIYTAYYPAGIKDANIGWESTSQFNVGADLGLWNSRLNITANYYYSNSFNLLFNQPLPALSGSSSILTNLTNSKVRNTGFELQVNGAAVEQKDFSLNINANISANDNKVLDMGGASTIFSRGAERSYITHITQEGQPIGMFYGFKVKGMVRESDMANIAEDDKHYNASTKSFPQGYVLKGPARSLAQSNRLRPGDLYFEDVNGDGVVDDDDKTVIGSPYAKFYYGFGINARYKVLDFTASFNGTYGNKVLDGQDYYLFNMEASGNQYKKVTERYRSEAEPGKGEVYRAARGGTQSNSTRLSTFYLQDGSFLRCTNMTLGCNIPNIAGVTNNAIKSLRIYVSADNPFTITNYLGYNPEVDYNDGANLTPGVDYGKYPLVTGYYFGLKVNF